MEERRWKLRADAAVPGRAAFAGRNDEVQCIALNFSPSGACLVFPGRDTVPRLFSLALGLEPAASPVRVVWRRADAVGVVFTEPRANTPDVIAD